MEYIVTMKDIRKYEVLRQLINKEIKGYQAAYLLGYSQVHISRLKQRLMKYGFRGLLRARHPSPRRIPDNLKEEVVKLYEEIYCDFNIMHFKEKLEENHNIRLSYETVRKILIEGKKHHPEKKKKVYRRRRRMPKAGMLIQMDGSCHRWLKTIPEKQWLIATIDDATSEVLFAKFYPYEGVFPCMEVIRKTIENKGIFYCLYVDRGSSFKTTRYGGLHVNVSPEQEDTQIERTLKELDINLIPANSPQAKGRIERLFKTFQDRLIKEMRLRDIKDYHQANRFLQEEYIRYHNKRFAHLEGVECVYKPLPQGINLDLIFCKKYTRKVNFDNTIKFEGHVIQLPPTHYRLSFAKCVVEVCELEDGRVYILYQGKLIHTARLSKNSKTYRNKREIEKFLGQREYEFVTL